MDLVELFLNYQKAFNSPMTYLHYKNNLKPFLGYIAKLHKPIKDINISDYNNFVIYLRSTGINNRTVLTYTRAVKTMYSYLFNYGYINNNAYEHFKLIRKPKNIKYPLLANEVNSIDDCFNLNNYLDLRNYCIVHLMLDNGLRVSEVINLKKNDISNIYIKVNAAKGQKDRIIPISDDLYSKLILLDSNDYLFNLKYSGIKSMIKRLKHKSGVKTLYCHLLRHTFATSYVFYGGNVAFLSLILGHSSLKTTEKYIHLANNFRLLDTLDVYRIKYSIR